MKIWQNLENNVLQNLKESKNVSNKSYSPSRKLLNKTISQK